MKAVTFLPILMLVFGSGCSQQPAPGKHTPALVAPARADSPAAALRQDTAAYRARVAALANNDPARRWPAQAAYPLPGAILPYKRVVAYYGNLYSPYMGVLGEYPKDTMISKLLVEVQAWQQADTTTPVLPALHYVAVTAQGSPGKDGKYRLRMPAQQIDKVLGWAREINAITFLDVQIGHSTVATEVPLLEKYLLQPDVHLGIDPEYSMKDGSVPCSKIGTMDAADINDAVEYLAGLVKTHHLPPKILIVHRFTRLMVTNYKQIKTVPEVQVVINMDGFGAKWLKLDSYRDYVAREPVQFTGFKIFYKYDKHQGKSDLYTPAEILQLTPKPIYIQYQ
jgi:hypothetical protein